MKRIWGLMITIMIVSMLIGCQSATNPSTPDTLTERPIPSQYLNLDVPIINALP